MLQDIAPHIYNNAYTPVPPTSDSLAVYFEEGRVLVHREDTVIRFPHFRELGEPGSPVYEEGIYLFTIDEDSYYLVLALDGLPRNGFTLENVQLLREATPKWSAFAGITGAQLNRWYRGHKYCGGCGKPFARSPKERAFTCDDCGIIEYPKISPAVIVGVVNGDTLLMSRYANNPNSRYALLAGFAEVGESIEDTVRREVMEEVGLRVKNLHYYKSQPWSLSDSLLLGFFAELDGSGDILLDENELAEAKWLTRAELPANADSFSLTSEMIEAFRTQGRAVL